MSSSSYATYYKIAQCLSIKVAKKQKENGKLAKRPKTLPSSLKLPPDQGRQVRTNEEGFQPQTSG